MRLLRRIIKLPKVLREMLALREELHKLEARVVQARSDALYRMRWDMLQQRRLLAEAAVGPPPVAAGPPEVAARIPLEECFRRLEELAPRAYAVWRELLEANARAYEGFPAHSCSVGSHEVAEMFRCFLRPYWGGRVLDIGCGPQPVPLYLQGYPLEMVWGIDPLSSPEDHPFGFVPGVAEFLPWADGQFHLVVAATSLDHVLLLDRALSEVRRVLVAPEGRFVVWVTYIEGSKPYDPYGDSVEKVDEYHLFHPDKEWFEKEIEPYFEICESFCLDEPYNSCFMSLRPR